MDAKATPPSYRELQIRVRELEAAQAARQTEQKRRQADEAPYRRLVEELPILICSFLSDGTITFVNQAYCDYFGKRYEELVGAKFLTFIPEEDRQAVLEPISRLNPANPTHVQEHPVITADGGTRWMRWVNRARFDHRGRATGYQSIGEDVTARKRSERVLREKQAELDLIYNTTSDLMALIELNLQGDADKRYRIASYNDAYWQTVHRVNKDVQREELDAITIPGLVAAVGWPPEASDAIIENYKAVMASKGLLKRVEVFPLAEGSLYLNSTYTPIFDGAGSCTHILFSAHDITTQERARLALQESETMFRQVTETIQDVFWMSSPGITAMTYVSPAYEQIWGSSRERLYRSPQAFIDAIHPDDVGAYTEQVRKFHTQGKAYTCEYRIRPSGGGERWIEERGYPVSGADGRAIQMTGICTDITERKWAEAERGRLQAQLQQAQKMESIGSLAGGIAHDFNNILSSIIGFTELALEDAPADSLQAGNLQEVFQSGLRAKNLVKQILSFARQSEEEIKPIQPSSIAREVLTFIRSSIPSNIEIESALESDALIMGNATQLHQVLMNLCTNAAQAMEARGGRLTMSIRDAQIDAFQARRLPGLKSGDYLQIDIADTGVGIAPHLKATIFEPYFTTKEIGEGTGLGLAVVHGIVDSYGGAIQVESAPGQGAVFHLYLPVVKSRPLERPTEKEVLPTGNERILFVDDEAPIARIGGLILERLGYTVTTRTSSVEALEIFRAKPDDFDLVVTDMTMPNMTGDELAARMAQIRPDIPVILCTGYSKRIPAENTGRGPVRASVYKPIVKRDLAAIVRKVLDEAPPTT